MFYTKVLPDDMKSRLDANFYRPEYLEIERKLEKLGSTSLDTLCSGVECGPFGGNAIADDLYAENGIAFIRPVNISSQIFDDSSLVKVPEAALIERNLKIYDGINLYFGRVGDPCVAIIDRKTSISPNIIIAKTDYRLADPHYLYAFSSCNFGIKQILRQLKTVAQPTTSTAAVRSLSVYKANPITQKYIGDKVRQAEELRAWAKYVQTNANDLIPAYINEIERYQHKSYRTVKLNPERLDSLFYHPDYIALESKMKSQGCKKLGLIATLIKQAWNKNRADDFEYFEIGGLDIGTGQVASVNTETSNAPSRAKTKVQQGDVLVSTVRPNRKNVGFIIKNANDVEMVATSGFSVLRFSSLKEAAFYHAWLRTDDATSQLMRWNSGSAYPAIDDNVPLNIIVPEFDKDFIDEWGQKLLDAQFAYVYAKQLTNAAKTLVEALIEGQLTEDQLIQAQQALEDGDNTLDKAILSKLSNEGYAVEGAVPLFSDIDELYRLLASANAADDSED